MTTIKEIALRANYSSSTVSRVLNHDTTLSVSPEARSKILSIAKELGYKTVQERKGTNTSKTIPGKVGVLICHSLEEELNDAYFIHIRQGVESECEKRGLDLAEVLRLSQLKAGKISDEIKNLIVVGRISEELLRALTDHLENVVYINHSTNDDVYDAVVIDFEHATRQAVEHLLELGYKDIGFIGGQEVEHFVDRTEDLEEGRKATFRKIMEEKGLFAEEKCLVGQFRISEGYRLMKEMIESSRVPEAVFASSDEMAVGALRALQENNYQVPDDVAIIGFNDIELASYASTPLTTVRVHTEEMGKTGVKLMIDRLEGRNIPMKVVLPTELIIRESCGSRKRDLQKKGIS
ncbi:LacI family DNA-binding transcriptional regulator [Bacillus sp. SB49]|uniref:LacI family DNA-binding transcriptional regulator n=1 Tax=Bacillus sp. SB49 TaxID=1071080 RepID=UPI0004272225|nr:LacI family DNA-binding transcriptional regulator [Bacillus sp. SB49]QHT45653.1 LacI family DNA-binding transcriptional regulator [Bacillus sp. SB49]